MQTDEPMQPQWSYCSCLSRIQRVARLGVRPQHGDWPGDTVGEHGANYRKQQKYDHNLLESYAIQSRQETTTSDGPLWRGFAQNCGKQCGQPRKCQAERKPTLHI